MPFYQFPTSPTEGENYFVQFDIFKLEPNEKVAGVQTAIEKGFIATTDAATDVLEGQGKQVISSAQEKATSIGSNVVNQLRNFKNLKDTFSLENIAGMLNGLQLTFGYDKRASEILHSIKLPLQMAPAESTRATYNDESVRDVQVVLDMMSGKRVDFTRAVALAQDETLDTISNTLNRLSNRAVNQMQQTFFEGPTKRDYSFSFNLIPRNREDSKKIENIVRRFHYHASTSKLGGGEDFFTYPEMVRFLFLDKEGKPLKVFSHSGHQVGSNPNKYESKSCFITDVNAEYGMMGDNLRFKSANNPLDRGMGTAKLAISLRETEYFTKRDYRGTTLRGDN